MIGKATALNAILGLGCMAAPGVAHAQRFVDVTATHLPAGLAGPCMDATAGDSDGDGDLDLALAMEFQANILLLNDGEGVFVNASDRLPQNAHDSEDVAFADFDGDGALDLVLVSEDDRTDELYLYDRAAARYADAGARLPAGQVSNALAVLDLDGDGAPDLLVGDIGANRVLMNDGHGNFRDETAERWPQPDLAAGGSRTQDLELADVDGDGVLDVIIANEGQNQLYLNKGGRLQEATAGNLPARIDETREIRAADIDGDGDSDLLVANVQFTMEQSAQDYLLLNDGRGAFTEADLSRFPEDARSNFTIAAVDLDGDGDLDILTPSTFLAGSRAEYAILAEHPAGDPLLVRASNMRIRDADGDGDSDVVIEREGSEEVFAAEGDRLVAPSGVLEWRETIRAQDMDIDGDGAPDITSTAFPLAARGAGSSLQALDIDRDGDVDVLITAWQAVEAVGDYLVLLNDGAGHFSAAASGAIIPAESNGNGFDVEAADFNADGLTDLFFCNRASLRGDAEGSGGLPRLLLGAPPGR